MHTSSDNKNFADSDSICIFPTMHYRKARDADTVKLFPDGQALSEINLKSIFRNLTSTSRYVVAMYSNKDTKQPEDPLEVSRLLFMYDGYLITVTDSGILNHLAADSTRDPLYVNITFKSDSTSSTLKDYSTVDISDNISESNYYCAGINFYFAAPNQQDPERFQLLDSSGEVPASSWVRFDQKSLQNIDGGVI